MEAKTHKIIAKFKRVNRAKIKLSNTAISKNGNLQIKSIIINTVSLLKISTATSKGTIGSNIIKNHYKIRKILLNQKRELRT